MPIHTSWKSMARGMMKTYGKGTTCYNFTDGGRICMSKKAWSVFYATGNEKYGEGFETKPRPKSVEETQELIDWYMKTMGIENEL